MSKVLVLDNYDSFTYNLVQIVEYILGKEVDVFRNDAIDLAAVDAYDSIILSPGPGLPDEAGILKPLLKQYGPTKKILGVCLGLQAIGEVYGCRLRNLDRVFHGIATDVQKTEQESPIFKGLDNSFTVGRYHSWVIDKETLVDDLLLTSVDGNGEVMSADHREHRVYGVQFHPESILTPEGKLMIENFLNC